MIETSVNRRFFLLLLLILFVFTPFYLSWRRHKINVFHSTFVDQLENYQTRNGVTFEDLFDSYGNSNTEFPSLDTIRNELNDVQGSDERIIREFIENDDSFTYKPPLTYLENLTNSCWLQGVAEQERSEKILCLPYFYLAGFPKCGTTDLWRRLQVLEDVALTQKEPHWWTRYRYENDQNRGGDMSAYTLYFKSLDTTIPGQIAGDGSQSTIWDDFLLQKETDRTKLSSEANRALSKHGILPIHQYTPKAKFIFLLRNPVDQLYSSYLYFRRKSDPLSQEDFHHRAAVALRVMRQCMRQYGVRQCAYSATVRKKTGSKMRIGVCIYVVFINDLLKTVPKENVLILTLNEYSLRRTAALKRVTDFLMLKVNDISIERMNLLEKANTRPEDVRIGPMLPRTRAMLQKFFHPFNQALAKIMEDKSLAVTAPEAHDLTAGDEEEMEDEEEEEEEEKLEDDEPEYRR